MATAQVNVYVFCEGCGVEVDASSYPEKASICSSCQTKRSKPKREIVEYRYERSCFCHPLSPTNVVHVGVYRTLKDGKKTDPAQREKEAMAAYEKELAFSGSEAEAKMVYASFFDKEDADFISLH